MNNGKSMRSKRLLATEIGMTVAGLTMAATPLALWVSPNKPAFYITLLVCGAAFGVIVLLCRYGAVDAATAGLKADHSGKVALTPEMIAHLQSQRELSRQELPELKKFVRDNIERPERPKDK